MRAIIPIPAFSDNYIWLLNDGRHAAVVDPGDAAPVVKALASRELELAAILLTHHHPDHVGGVAALTKGRELAVFGPPRAEMPRLTHPLRGGESIALPELGLAFSVMSVPGHTRDHLAYFGEAGLFCGDTLFSAGCGRIFEGTPAEMHASLAALAALPDATAVYCAHEYTLANLRFALAVEPDNEALRDREREAKRLRAEGRPTLPSNLALERATNPFLRCHVPAVIAAAEAHVGRALANTVEVFAVIREWKNGF
jgi:hydroxyacylglutathione hydrolase